MNTKEAALQLSDTARRGGRGCLAALAKCVAEAPVSEDERANAFTALLEYDLLSTQADAEHGFIHPPALTPQMVKLDRQSLKEISDVLGN